MSWLIRSGLEWAVRNRVFKRRLPAEFRGTPLYVAPESQLKYLKPGRRAFDHRLLDVVAACIREDSRVWDIGANVGVLSFAAASKASQGTVLAVEPDPWLVALMKRSLRLRENRGLLLRVLPAAVSDTNGAASFAIAERGRASNFLEQVGGRSQAGGVRESLLVPTLTMDALLDSTFPPTFVKIDVEGAEHLALRGATRLLSDVRPVVFIEVGSVSAGEIEGKLRESGYCLFDGARPIDGQQPMRRCSFNTLAVPEERCQDRCVSCG